VLDALKELSQGPGSEHLVVVERRPCLVTTHYPSNDYLTNDVLQPGDRARDAQVSGGVALRGVHRSYGRRRVGKTALLTEFCRTHTHLLPRCPRGRISEREKFLAQVAEQFDERVPRIDSWNEAFESLSEKLKTKDLDSVGK
jgi:hypothetical protein